MEIYLNLDLKVPEILQEKGKRIKCFNHLRIPLITVRFSLFIIFYERNLT